MHPEVSRVRIKWEGESMLAHEQNQRGGFRRVRSPPFSTIIESSLSLRSNYYELRVCVTRILTYVCNI